MKQAILWDCHMHSSFSADSDTPMEDMIQKAIDTGLRGICLTEHLDPDYPDIYNLDFSLDTDSYYRRLKELQEKYASKLDVRFGVELGLQPHLSAFFTDLLEKYPFDFVIASSHLVNGMDPYYPEYFRDRSEETGYRAYFESILENINVFDKMDVYGHIDYIVRYGPNKNRDYSYEKYQDILDEILIRLISLGRGIELNTGGYHYGLGEPNPCTAVIRRYRELGGEIITIGADAHAPGRIAYAFDLAAQVLLSCGFSHYTVFKNRRPEFIPL